MTAKSCEQKNNTWRTICDCVEVPVRVSRRRCLWVMMMVMIVLCETEKKKKTLKSDVRDENIWAAWVTKIIQNQYLRRTIPFVVDARYCPRSRPLRLPWWNKNSARVKTGCGYNNRSLLWSWTVWTKRFCRTENTMPCKVRRSKQIQRYSTTTYACDPTQTTTCSWATVQRRQLQTAHIPQISKP